MVVFKRSSLRRQTSVPLYASPPKTRHDDRSTSYPSTAYNERQWMPPNQRQSSLSGIKVGLVAILMILPWLPYVVVRMSFNSAEHRVLSLFDQRREATNAFSVTKDTIRRLKEQEKSMQGETRMLFATLRTIGPLADSKEYEQAEMLEEGMLNQIDSVHEFIQAKSRIANKQKYGRIPRKISFELDLPDEDESTFVVQLSDSRFMPHSTQVFLDMVTEQLWDGHKMIRRDSSVSASKINKMKNSKQLLFAEQSNSVSRGKHSICFSGVGPFFYISLDDSPINDEDPCFGSVVENSGILHRLPESTRIYKIRVMDEP